jgi:translation initiation factor 2 beta subunit (eIF-2beta)/eIF-5
MGVHDGMVGREIQHFEICPKCKSLANSTDLSSGKKLMTKCLKCGYEAEINEFREHDTDEKFTV